ncbi:MAG: TIGR03936 family radical SAM-associated protein [Lachnospiraceae bacterium]|nr:TIGR03936 family radical SAM-associated protein [Lachnospiraceae bacterium]
MNVRVAFAKYGRLRFLGHLDIMRFVQRAFSRCGLPIGYSQGFHPHMLLSFAQPLALSVTSDGEYFDVVIDDETLTGEEIAERLNTVMCDGITILNAVVLPPQEPNTKKQTGMSQIAGAMYLCEESVAYAGRIEPVLRELCEKKTFCVGKATKKGDREVDVRAGIRAAGVVREDGSIEMLTNDGAFSVPVTLAEGFGLERSMHSEHEAGRSRFLFAVNAGSENNISVDLVADAIRSLGNLEEGRMFSSHRMELYGLKDEKMVSLSLMK